MDSIEITRELHKINALHGSLDETNILTYIIFAATFEPRLNPEQLAWIENKIMDLKNQSGRSLLEAVDGLDMEVTNMPLSAKFEDIGRMLSPVGINPQD